MMDSTFSISLKAVEYSFRAHNIMRLDDSFINYLSNNSLVDLKSDFTNYSHEVLSGPNDFVHILSFWWLSKVLENYCTRAKDYKVRINSKLLKKGIDSQLTDLISDKFIVILNWDIERRTWNNYDSEYELKYITDSVDEIDKELNGDSQMVFTKYFDLILDYLENYFHEGLLHPELYNSYLERDLFDEDIPYKAIEQIGIFKTNRNDLIKIFDTPSLRLAYREIAEQYLSGLKDNDRISYSFIQALVETQSKYKKNLLSQIDFLKTMDSKPILQLAKEIKNENYAQFVIILKSLFSSVPNVLIKNTNESYYHIFIHLVMNMIGVDFESEVMTNLGRIDGVLKTPIKIIIIEFKIFGKGDAIEQILNKRYYERYLNDRREISILGIDFSKDARNISGYAVYNFDKEKMHTTQQPRQPA